LKPERWGSLLVQEKYQEEKACDKRYPYRIVVVVVVVVVIIIIIIIIIIVAARSKAWVCSRSLSRIAVSNPAGAWMSVSWECCALSSRGLCSGLTTRP